MKRILYPAFAVFSYAAFLACFLYTVGFLANFGVPETVDADPTSGPWIAALVNLGVLGIFGLQHSVMARPGFKRWWTRIVPEPIERAVYVLASVAALGLVIWAWQPIAGTVWQIDNEIARASIWALYLGGYGMVFASTALLNHFEIFGLRQAFLFAADREYFSLPFETPAFYKYIRHPLYVGWFMVLWCTPDMSVGRLLFAGVSSVYIFVGLVYEERDLVAHFGETYERYREQVPALVPLPGRKSDSPAEITG
jgi:protein-S-isoprenylcysteine O-methyltransferase Ste14